MTSLRAWLARQARLQGRYPRLADALLTGRGWRYAAYRVRYGLLRVALRTGLHIVELALLSMVFPLAWLAPVFVVRTASALFAALYWGGLEALREQVRALARQRQPLAVGRLIDDWLVLSGLLAMMVQLAAVGWAVFGPDPVGGFSIFDAYALAMGLRVGLETIARTYHSGLFALQRVHRPLWTLALVDALEMLGPLLLWRWAGTWSFAGSVLAVGCLRFGLLVHFTRVGYRRAGLAGRRLLQAWRRFPRRLPLLGLRRAAITALSAGAGQVDALVILALVAVQSSEAHPLELVATLFVLSPLLGASVGWSRVFYFDFKRLEYGAPELFVRRFERLLVTLAVAFPILAWALALAATGLVAPALLRWSSALLLPLFVARSLFALRHVQAFSYDDHRAQAGLALTVGLGVGCVALLPREEGLVLGALTLVLAGAVAGIPAARRPSAEPHLESAPVLSLPRWLAVVGRGAGPSRVWVARFDSKLTSFGRSCAALRRALHAGAFARLGPDTLACLSLGDASGRRERNELVVAAGGGLTELACAASCSNGHQALAGALGALALDVPRRRRGVGLRHARGEAPPRERTPDALRETFERRFPAGELVSLDSRVRGRSLPLRPADVRQLLACVAAARDGRAVRRVPGAAVDGAVFAPLGEAELVFVLPREAAADERGAFKRKVRRASLAATLVALEVALPPRPGRRATRRPR